MTKNDRRPFGFEVLQQDGAAAGARDLRLWCRRYACLYASGYSGIGESHDAGTGCLYRRPDNPVKHLSSDAQART